MRGEKVIKVSRPMVTSALFHDGPARRVELPDDVETEALWHADDGTGYFIRLSSSEWDETEEGESLERINPTIHSVYPDE